MKLLKDFGIFAWGTGISEKVFFKLNIQDEKYQIDKFLPDARVVRFDMFQTDIKFYAYEYIAGNICFSIYRTIWDAAGADRGAYICSILIDKDKGIDSASAFDILNKFSDTLWEVYLEDLNKKYLTYNPDIKHFEEIPVLIEKNLKNESNQLKNFDKKIGYYKYKLNENPFIKLKELELANYSRIYLLPDSHTFSFSDSEILPCEKLKKTTFDIRLKITDEKDRALENVTIMSNNFDGISNEDGKFERTVEFETNIRLKIETNGYLPLEFNIQDKDIKDNRYTNLIVLKSVIETDNIQSFNIAKNNEQTEEVKTQEETQSIKKEDVKKYNLNINAITTNEIGEEIAGKPQYTLIIKAVEKDEKGSHIPLSGVICKVNFSDSSKNRNISIETDYKLEGLNLDDEIRIVASKGGYGDLVMKPKKVSEYLTSNQTFATIDLFLTKKQNWIKKIKLSWIMIAICGLAIVVIFYFFLFNATGYTLYYANERKQLDSIKNEICNEKLHLNSTSYDKQLAVFETKKLEYDSIAKTDSNFSKDSIEVENYEKECKACYVNKVNKLKTEINSYLKGIDFDLKMTNSFIEKAKQNKLDTANLVLFRNLCIWVGRANKIFREGNKDVPSDELIAGFRCITGVTCTGNDFKYEFLSEDQLKELHLYRRILIRMNSANYTNTSVVLQDFELGGQVWIELNNFLNNRKNK